MDYGYSRCSTNEGKQDINRQVRELRAAGAQEIFMEYEHGDAKVKSQQAQMFAAAQRHHHCFGGFPACQKHTTAL